MLDHLVPIERSVLFAPLEELGIELEPLRDVPRIEFPTHREFMNAHGQDAWEAWQCRREVRIPASAAPSARAPRQRDPRGRFIPRQTEGRKP